MATKTGTEAPGGAKEAFPPFQQETFPSQIVWFAIAFIALYVLMARVALPRIGAIFEKRRNTVAGDLAEAQRLKDMSDAAIAAYEKALADARSRAQSLANEKREALMAEAEAGRKRLERELNAKLAAAEDTITATKAAAMANVQSIASEAASAIVKKLTGKAPPRKAVADAVAQVLKR